MSEESQEKSETFKIIHPDDPGRDTTVSSSGQIDIKLFDTVLKAVDAMEEGKHPETPFIKPVEEKSDEN